MVGGEEEVAWAGVETERNGMGTVLVWRKKLPSEGLCC
jgi:hypothetical protein